MARPPLFVAIQLVPTPCCGQRYFCVLNSVTCVSYISGFEARIWPCGPISLHFVPLSPRRAPFSQSLRLKNLRVFAFGDAENSASCPASPRNGAWEAV